MHGEYLYSLFLKNKNRHSFPMVDWDELTDNEKNLMDDVAEDLNGVIKKSYIVWAEGIAKELIRRAHEAKL